MYLFVSMCGYVHISRGVLSGQKGAPDSPGAEVTGSCELTELGIGSKIWVLCKSWATCLVL